MPKSYWSEVQSIENHENHRQNKMRSTPFDSDFASDVTIAFVVSFGRFNLYQSPERRRNDSTETFIPKQQPTNSCRYGGRDKQLHCVKSRMI